MYYFIYFAFRLPLIFYGLIWALKDLLGKHLCAFKPEKYYIMWNIYEAFAFQGANWRQF